MFEKLTKAAFSSLMYAADESRRLGHNYVGDEMILLGLMRVESEQVLMGKRRGLAEEALSRFGLTLVNVRQEVEKIIGRGSGEISVKIAWTPRALRIIQLCSDKVLVERVKQVGTEYLLLALLQEVENCRLVDMEIGVVGEILEARNIDLSQLKDTVIKLMED